MTYYLKEIKEGKYFLYREDKKLNQTPCSKEEVVAYMVGQRYRGFLLDVNSLYADFPYPFLEKDTNKVMFPNAETDKAKLLPHHTLKELGLVSCLESVKEKEAEEFTLKRGDTVYLLFKGGTSSKVSTDTITQSRRDRFYTKHYDAFWIKPNSEGLRKGVSTSYIAFMSKDKAQAYLDKKTAVNSLKIALNQIETNNIPLDTLKAIGRLLGVSINF